jgi:hypothetical protein
MESVTAPTFLNCAVTEIFTIMIIMNMAVYPITSLENIVNFIMKTRVPTSVLLLKTGISKRYSYRVMSLELVRPASGGPDGADKPSGFFRFSESAEADRKILASASR